MSDSVTGYHNMSQIMRTFCALAAVHYYQFCRRRPRLPRRIGLTVGRAAAVRARPDMATFGACAARAANDY